MAESTPITPVKVSLGLDQFLNSEDIKSYGTQIDPLFCARDVYRKLRGGDLHNFDRAMATASAKGECIDTDQGPCFTLKGLFSYLQRPENPISVEMRSKFNTVLITLYHYRCVVLEEENADLKKKIFRHELLDKTRVADANRSDKKLEKIMRDNAYRNAGYDNRFKRLPHHVPKDMFEHVLHRVYKRLTDGVRDGRDTAHRILNEKVPFAVMRDTVWLSQEFRRGTEAWFRVCYTQDNEEEMEGDIETELRAAGYMIPFDQRSYRMKRDQGEDLSGSESD